ncbi:MAG TPA: GNAT family N-acetyltransferase [Roseiflexaceae bacterium]|nr:GNAT family N-acetyltransferase [Roseiflexaceae bacterium]
MYPALTTILEPPARARRAREQNRYFERDAIPVISRRGRRLSVRPVAPGDAPSLAALLAGLSERSMQLRFFRPLKDVSTIWREAARVANGSPLHQAALLATTVEGGEERAVAIAELVHDSVDRTAAEFALLVHDDYQREGVGRMLCELLVHVAMLRGIQTLRATMLAENLAIRKLVRDLGLPYRATAHWGEITATIALPRS